MHKTLTLNMNTTALTMPSVTVYGTEICTVLAVTVENMSIRTLRHLLVRSSHGRILTLEDHGDLQDYGEVYTNAVDLYEIKEILAALSAHRPDGKIKIDKPAIITLKKAGLRFLHPDTGEEMNVREVFTALSNMAAEKASKLTR